jgi:Ca2+-binding RTX toxin-like protein
MEMLESRRLFSVTFDQGVLDVTGTNVADLIGVRLRYERVDGHNVTMARVTVNGRSKTYGSVTSLVVDGRGGNDTITVSSDALPAGWRAIDTTLLGGDGNDALMGSITNDYLDGGNGMDGLDGGAGGHDSLFGGADEDSLLVNRPTFDDVYLCSGEGADTIWWNFEKHTGDDHAANGIGWDDNQPQGWLGGQLMYSSVVDANGILHIRGGDGDDRVTVWVRNEGIEVDIRTSDYRHNRADLYHQPASHILGIEVLGGAGDDHLYVVGQFNHPVGIPVTLMGQEGNDQLVGGDGNDVLLGGAGEDTISGGGGVDQYDTGGNDSFVSFLGSMHIEGRTLVVEGTVFDDVIDVCDDGDDPQYMLVRMNGRDYAALDGRLIDDVRIEGGDGDDNVGFETRGLIRDGVPHRAATVSGGAGDDEVYASVGDDVLDGGAGNDYLDNWGGADTFIGGEGDDFIRVAFPEDVTLGGPGENVIWAWRRAIAGSDGMGSIEETGPDDDAPTFFPPDDASTDGEGGSQASGDISDADLAVVSPPVISGFGDAFSADARGWWLDGGGDQDRLWDTWDDAPGQAA